MISVCIPTYNGEKYIKEQLDSILSQLSDDDEIIISDDSSTDNTVSIIKSINDGRIQLLENNQFKSPIFNLENALKKAKGEYIFLSDQDDIWMPDKVEAILKYLKLYDLCTSDCSLIDSNGNITEESYHKKKSRTGFWRNIIKNSYIGCCMAFRREVLDYVLPFPRKIPMHDIWIGLNVQLNGRDVFIDDKLILYRRHGNNASFTGDIGGSQFSISYRIKYRIVLLFLLFKRNYRVVNRIASFLSK